MSLPKFPYPVKVGNATVPIYHSLNGKYHEFKVASYAGGKRRLETFANFDAAKERAYELLRALNAGEVETLTMCSSDVIQFSRATAILKPYSVSLQEATLDYAEARKLLNDATLLEAAQFYRVHHPISGMRKTVSEVADEFIRSRQERRVSSAHLRNVAHVLNHLKANFQCDITSVSGPALEKHLNQEKHSARTVNTYKKLVAAFFNFAKKRGYLPKDWDKLNAVETRQIIDNEITVYSPSEMVRLLVACDAVRESYVQRRKNGKVIVDAMRPLITPHEAFQPVRN